MHTSSFFLPHVIAVEQLLLYFSVINLKTSFLKALSPFFPVGALVQLLRETPQAEQSLFIPSQHRQEGCSGLANPGTDSLRMHSNISHLSSWLPACQTVCWLHGVRGKQSCLLLSKGHLCVWGRIHSQFFLAKLLRCGSWRFVVKVTLNHLNKWLGLQKNWLPTQRHPKSLFGCLNMEFLKLDLWVSLISDLF